MKLMTRIESLTHRHCKTAMSRLRADLREMNAEKAQMAQTIVSLRRYTDELTEQLEAARTVNTGE